MGDRLNMDYINSLPQPLAVRCGANRLWEVKSIDVETGLIQILVCGLPQIIHIGEALAFRDLNGVEHNPETFYN